MRKYVLFFMLCNTFATFAQYCNTEQGTVAHYVTTQAKDGKVSNSSIVVESVTDEGGTVRINIAKYGDKFTPQQVRRKLNKSMYLFHKDNGKTEYLLMDSETENKASRKFFESGYQPGHINEADFGPFRKDIWAKGKIGFMLEDGAKAGENITECSYEEKMGPGLKFKASLNGQYQGTESVETPAGRFECLKVRTESKGDILKARRATYTSEWYAKGVGLVKAEVYNKRGNLIETTLLQSIDR